MVAELVLAVIATVDGCIRLGRQTIDTYRAYRDTDESLDDKIVVIEGLWAKLETQLTFLSKVSEHLDDKLAESQINLLLKLHGKLVQVTSQIDLPASTHRRKLKHALVKDKLDELLADMETWQARFDPTWFIITLIGNRVIDAELWESRRANPAKKAFDSSPLHSMLALRHAIRPQSGTVEPTDRINLSINLDSSGLKDARITPVPFSSARVVFRRGSDKLLISETVHSLGEDISHVKQSAENLARKLKCVDSRTFSLLRCFGIVKQYDESQRIKSMDMIYSAPQTRADMNPTSLRGLLLERKPVSVSAVVRVARQLVQSVSYVHACDFVHKNIRPESVLVFQGDDGSALGSAFLTGFSQFRDTCFQTHLKGDPRWHLNLYRHPQRQATCVQHRYIMQHDIYSLGVCLLEIGLWTSFVWYPENMNSDDATPVPGLGLGLRLSDTDFATIGAASRLQTKEHFVSLARKDLPPRVGDKYTNLVVACLTCLDPGNAAFGSERELLDDDGILVGVRFVEKILSKMADISV
ncbi:uncharacterized protein J7T54_001523 [Emericellopsis cladophorae]|uniref:Protein kinase domain-containing protein n=1 Tax=Emericellopsis cladophorae TaxID=2686198 RepID=A0A9P9XUY8_9HYPO|nr:uncharacterized protein J7T54_001523 [Emericellopsis cladophorae]KAI6778103.1 hypothetical protein J7T54_001523 [Emericellopsis cladophorae]